MWMVVIEVRQRTLSPRVAVEQEDEDEEEAGGSRRRQEEAGGRRQAADGRTQDAGGN